MDTSATNGSAPVDAEAGHDGRKANRLIDSTSPYLLQHAYNPVDWHPWSAETIEKAVRENKPIFLSIGYAACHWCHVMEREVFENEQIAELMNTNFINIKVDREERPDLDDLYMLATQLMTGQGGWPMSVWLMPTLEPFYAGTYFPPVDGYGRPGFPRLCLALADSWRNRRPELLTQAKKVVDAIRIHADETAHKEASGRIDLTDRTVFSQLVQSFIEHSQDRFDPDNGGLGSAPKFPPHQALQLWLMLLQFPQRAKLTTTQISAVEAMAIRTLDALMNGGIFDQVGGAFARYSTDAKWLVPHFEKMLYDNAQLAPLYAIAAQHFKRPDYERVARQTLDFWLREMRSPKGGLYSTLDADSDGAEGKFYVWTPAEIRESVGNDADATLLCEHLGVTTEGNWHESPTPHGTVVSVVVPIDRLAATRGVEPAAMRTKIDGLLLKLRKTRATRVPPGLDDKILTSWNGLMISALAIAGTVLREPRYLEASHQAIGYLLIHHMEAGRRLMRVSREGRTHTPAFLEDHAYLLNGLLDIVDATLPTSLPGVMARKRALEMAETLIREFEDSQTGGFFQTSPTHDALPVRLKNAADNATPSPNAVAIRALLRLARSSGKEQYRAVAHRAIAAFAPNVHRRPDFFPTILLAILEDQHGNVPLPVGHLPLGTSSAAPASLPPLGFQTVPPLDQSVAADAHLSEPFTLRLGKVEPLEGIEPFTVELIVEVAPGIYVQSHNPHDKEAIATIARIRVLDGGVSFVRQEWNYPPVDASQHHTGQLRLQVRCQLATFPSASAPPTFRISFYAQPCTSHACYPPETRSIDVTLPMA